jgi:hypothetical protein
MAITKTKILTYNYKSTTIKRADVRKAIKEVNAEYAGCEEANEGQIVLGNTRKVPAAGKPHKK